MTAKKMSADTAIRLKGVGKRYMISTFNMRETFLQTLSRLCTGSTQHRPLWALKDISFELGRGEILGVIGPNGAGKSTLLILLAEVLGPTEGRVEVNGGTNIFFQLGSGLQPQLTVLDNFSVCAALLGMPRERFQEILPAIVAYSGLKDYLHARYGELSSGLAARVPFATAVHADLDIIMADEMIAVGDVAFQKKCFATFDDLRGQGKTMVLVSHSMDLIVKLSTKVLYLDKGRLVYLGDPREAVRRYGADVKSRLSAIEKPRRLL